MSGWCREGVVGYGPSLFQGQVGHEALVECRLAACVEEVGHGLEQGSGRGFHLQVYVELSSVMIMTCIIK